MRANLIFIVFAMLAVTLQGQKKGTFIDERDGHEYKWVKIGEQVWMAENLAYKAGEGCFAFNNDEGNVATYGRLYNWKVAQNVCPTGWHIPTEPEFQILAQSTVVNHNSNTLKAIGQGTGDGSGTNSSGFSALLAGYRNSNGYFNYLGYTTYFWSSTESGSNSAYDMGLWNDGSGISLSISSKSYGFSVRCVKDIF